MKSINEVFSPLKLEMTQSNAVLYKTALLKQEIIVFLIKHERATIAELAQATKTSIPKINETVTELIEDGLVLDYGKIVNGVGRKPNIYGLNPDCAYFVSVEANRHHMNIAIINFAEEITLIKKDIPFILENTPASFDTLCSLVEDFIQESGYERSKFAGLGLNLTGRINHDTGNSYSYFNFHGKPLSTVLAERFSISAYIENDTRAMAFGEYAKGVVEAEKNILFINLDEGIGMGIIIDGSLYSGKSGYAGEFGHMPFLHNDLLCHCGKKGCLETEASGLALIQQMKTAISKGVSTLLTDTAPDLEQLKLQDIVTAALRDDMLSIDLISQAGGKIGKGIAILLNLFNPELVILGGKIARSGPIVMLPILSSINKYSLSLVNTDTQFKTSQLDDTAGLLGTSLLIRNRLLGI
ncbi:MAG TPA: ROK family transcriptional regulator [Sphingobacterium sp.]|jgi:predicted NBD/HSP70 family sugar kinase|nr:ROK family transcriptional regulator [Sphingobacterium sp.]